MADQGRAKYSQVQYGIGRDHCTMETIWRLLVVYLDTNPTNIADGNNDDEEGGLAEWG